MFCKECGHRFLAEEDTVICPICNQTKGKGHSFCPFCGEPMKEGQIICSDCGLNIDGEISQMGDGTIDTGYKFYHVKARNLYLCAILTFFTCGTYLYYWMICLSEDYAVISEQKNDRILIDVLLITFTCGLYGIYWAYKQGIRYEEALRRTGREPKNMKLIFSLVSAICGPVTTLLVMQHYMNKF